MRFRRVPEFDNERMALERVLNDAALNALSATVNQADLPEPGVPRSLDIVADECLDIARLERVEVDRILDRDLHAAG
jgi:hypothetical protein